MEVKLKYQGKTVRCKGPTLSEKQLMLLQGVVSARAETGQQLSEKAAALGHATRMNIFLLLSIAGEICVCDIATVLEISPSAVSQHLAKLRSARIVISRRDSQTIYYSLQDCEFCSVVKSILLRSPSNKLSKDPAIILQDS